VTDNLNKRMNVRHYSDKIKDHMLNVTMRLAIKMRDMKGIENEVPRGLTNDIYSVSKVLSIFFFLSAI